MTDRIAPWADRPSMMTPEQGAQLADDIIAWREAGYPDPGDFATWTDDDQLDMLMSRPSQDTLILSALQLEALPPALAGIEDVGTIFLDNNRLRSLPVDLARQPLENLSLSGNPLEALPVEILAIPTLTGLYLDNTALTTLPLPPAPHPGLRTLGLGGLPDLTIADGFFAALPELRAVVLGGSPRATLPAELFALPHLLQIDAEDSGLAVLPDAIGDVATLRALNLKNCRLTTLPRSLARLDLLRESAAKGGPFGLAIAGNPFADPELRRIAALKNPEATRAALDWAAANGS